MKHTFLIVILTLFIVNIGYAQRGSKGELVGVGKSWVILDFQSKQVPKEARKYVQNLRLIPAGSFHMGEDYYDSISYSYSLSYSRVISIDAFYMSETEVPNWLYREFCQEMVDSLGKEAASKFLPDTLCWIRDNNQSDLENLTRLYFQHPAYDNYPVVGVSFVQAYWFCDWLTQKVRKELSKSKKTAHWTQFIDFRLPNEEEWEHAARGGREMSYYPWGPYFYTSENNKLVTHANCGAIIDTLGGIALGAQHDGYRYSGEIYSYEPNEYGMYNTSGNVAEWTLTKYDPIYNSVACDICRPSVIFDSIAVLDSVLRVVKGGSYNDFPYFLGSGNRTGFDAYTQSRTIGFRVAMSFISRSDFNEFYEDQ